MGRMKFWRFATTLAIALCGAAVLLALFLLLPAVAALGCAIIGMVLFKVGAHLGWSWSTVIGGIGMFSGVFAWAMNVTAA